MKASEKRAMSAAVINALRDGLGVEDIAVMGIAPVEHSRAVVGVLREAGMIKGICKRSWRLRGKPVAQP